MTNGLRAKLIVSDSVNVEQFGAKGDGETDDTAAIQNAINFAYTNNISVNLLEKTYISGALTLYADITIQGKNREKSKFLLKEGLNASFISLTDVEVKRVTLRDFKIDGNKANNTCPYGIYTNQNSDMHHLFENLIIEKIYGTGMQTGRGENRIDNIYIHHCDGYGFIHAGSDDLISRISAAWNHSGGIYEAGSSSRWINCKGFVNGESDGVMKTTDNGNAYGFRISDGHGSEFIACDAQENYGHGFYISSYKNASLISCNSDNNGMINKDLTDESYFEKKFGFVFTNCDNCKLIGFTNNFRYSSLNVRWQYGSISFGDTNITNCSFEINSSNQIEELYVESYANKVTILKNNNNYFKLNNLNYDVCLKRHN